MPTASDVLYFPSIEFRDDNWLKHSLLLWDTVHRIVPNDYAPHDRRQVLEAVDEGRVRNLTLEREDLEETADSFARFYEQLPTKPAGLTHRRPGRLHIDKVDRRLYPLLERLADKFDAPWFRLQPSLARGYMLHLSQSVAERRNLARGTDDSDSWTVASFFSEGGQFADYIYDDDAEAFYCSLIIDKLLPLNLADIPMTEVLKVAQKTEDLRREFRNHVHDLSTELSLCDSPDFARQIIHDRTDSIERLKYEYKRSIGFGNPDDLYSTFVIGTPVALTAYGGLAGALALADPIRLSGSLLIGAVAALVHYRNALRHRQINPVGHYLVELDERLARNHSYRAYDRIFDQFLND